MTAVVSAKDLTREQFQALPSDAVIEINGEHITKRDFQARNLKGLQEAAKQLGDNRRGALGAALRNLLAEPRRPAGMGPAHGLSQHSWRLPIRLQLSPVSQNCWRSRRSPPRLRSVTPVH